MRVQRGECAQMYTKAASSQSDVRQYVSKRQKHLRFQAGRKKHYNEFT